MRRALLLSAVGLLLLGCGQSEGRDAPTSASSSVDVDSDATDVATSRASTTVTPTSSTQGAAPASSQPGDVTILEEIPNIPIDGPVRDESVPYFGRQSPSGGTTEPAAGFVPAPVDVEFCSAVAVINSRPQPSDDYDEVVVAARYFDAIEQYVPAELAAPFAVVLQIANDIADAGSFAEADEPSDRGAFPDAIETLNEFVDTRCLGIA